MQRSGRRRTVLCACLASLALAAVAAPGAPAAVPELTWTDCGEGFECATAAVPLDYLRPDGDTIDLAMIRKPATDPARRIGSLFLNPVAPAAPPSTSYGRPASSRPALNDRFDLVGWDPRGTGLSEGAVDCDVNQEVLGPYSQPFPRPFTDAEAGLTARTREYLDRCMALSRRELLPYFTTGNTVRDLDLLRQAVGDAELTFLGFSYGTAIGATYATLFPETHRALVLDGAVDDAWFDRYVESTREQTSGLERALGRFLTACAADQAACSGFGGTDPWTAFDELLERLDREPVPAADAPGRPVDGDDARSAASLGMYNKGFWGILAAGLAQAEAGDGSLLRLLTDVAYGREDDGTYDPSTDQFVAVTGVDTRREGGPRFYVRAGRHSYRTFDHFWFNSGYGDMPFGLWPARARGVFRGPFENRGRGTDSARHRHHLRPGDAVPLGRVAHPPAGERTAADHARRRPHGVRRQLPLHRRGRRGLPRGPHAARGRHRVPPGGAVRGAVARGGKRRRQRGGLRGAGDPPPDRPAAPALRLTGDRGRGARRGRAPSAV